MKREEKGALKIDGIISKSTNDEGSKKNSSRKDESKNSKISDFFGNSDSDFSNKKRTRSSNDEVCENQPNIRNESKPELIELSDDMNEKENNSYINNDSNPNSVTKISKKKKNRSSCSICRNGGDLLLCDNCPKSFHRECLKMKVSDVPEGDWYCPECIPIIARRKQKQESVLTLDERKKQKREKRRQYRLKKKEELKKLKLQNSSTHHGHSSRMKSLSGRKIKGRGKLNESLSQKEDLNINKFNINALENKSSSQNGVPSNNPINKILLDNSDLSYNLPAIPVISEEIQNKLLEETKRMEASLFSKFNKGSKMNTDIMKNFLMNGKRKALKEASAKEKIIESIDLTADEPLDANTTRININSIPSDEEAKKVLESVIRNNTVDFSVLTDLSKNNPILYAKVNNMYLNSLKIQSVTISNNANKENVIMQKKNVKYPIEDSELYKNPETYSLSRDYFNKPEGVKSVIASEHMTKLLKIWDFVITFKSKLNISEFTPEQLYFSLNHFNEEEIPLITEVHSALLFPIGEQIQTTDYNFLFNSQEMDLILLKSAVENHSGPIRLLYKKSWLEIFRILINSKMFNLMVTQDLLDLSTKFKYVDNKNYNLLSYEEKIMLLEYLVNTVLNTEFIRDTVKEDMDKRNELNKEKSSLQWELKSIDSRKREIERQEKFTQPRVKVETLTKKLQTLVEDNPDLSRQELTRLRKDIEYEREQFKSVIKEGDEIENTRNKIVVRIEKISLEIHEIPSTNKKLIGSDGLKNEYYFYPYACNNNKLYVKKFLAGSKRFFEWRELRTEEEIKDLMSRLSEKGIRESMLLTKINKLYPKRLKVIPSNYDKMTVDIDIRNDEVIVNDQNQKQIEEILKSALEWKNTSIEKLNKKNENLDLHDEIIENLLALEEKIAEYFYQDDKEWESFDIKQNWKAWLCSIRKIPEYAKSIILFNNRFQTPYKINESRPRIINDEDFNCFFNIFDPQGTLDPYITNPIRIIAPKARLWSRDLNTAEEYFISYCSNVLSFPQLFFAFYVFESVFNNLIKRREVYKKKYGKDGKDNYNLNEFDDESSSHNFTRKKKDKNADDMDLDDFYYDESLFKDDVFVNIENQSNNNYYGTNNLSASTNNITKSKLTKEKENKSHLNEDKTRSRRLCTIKNVSQSYNAASSSNTNPRKKIIDWNDNCYMCDEHGDLICCEDCPNVAHTFCIGLKKEPDTWRCEDCLSKLANKRMTRSSKY